MIDIAGCPLVATGRWCRSDRVCGTMAGARTKRRSWRWTSTPLSADRGEVSVLAVVETLCATSISLGIAWYYDTITHIAVSACIAPLLLLRTKRSVALGLRLMRKFPPKRLPGDQSVFDALFYLCIGVPLIAFAYRIYATVQCLFCRPIDLISDIPSNWTRATLCIDSAHHPEIIPGIERRNQQYVLRL